MVKEQENNKENYIKEAIKSFGEIMANSHKGTVDNFNRPNKGEIFVLQFLSAREKSVVPSELSEALQSSTARISALLAKLEQKGHIKREIDTNNRNHILVTITEAGRKRAIDEMAKMEAILSQVFAEMGEADTIEFVRLAKSFFRISHSHMSDFKCKNE